MMPSPITTRTVIALKLSRSNAMLVMPSIMQTLREI
jgi:hypothetical protein